MKKTMKLISMTALALMGAMMTGCSEDDNIINETPTPQPAHKTVTLTTTVSMDGATTRALDADGNKTFATGDQIAIIYEQVDGTTAKAVSEPLPEGSYTNTTTFTVTLTDPQANGEVRYIYPAAMAADAVETSTPVTDASTINYTALALQDGTLANLAANLDFAMYDGKMTANAELPDSPELDNQLVVCAFEIKNDAGTDVTSNITRLIVKDGTNTYNVTRSDADGPIYVAMLPVTAGDIVFEATNTEKDCYIRKMSNKTLTAGLLYPLRVKLISPLAMPLTFEAKDEGGATVTCTVGSNIGSTGDTKYLEFSVDGGANWTRRTLDSGETISVTLENEGDKVMFRGDNNRLARNSGDDYTTNFSGSGNCYVYGNVMSILYPTTFATDTSLPNTYDNKTSSYTFYRLFRNNTTIYNHTDKKLYLPATERLNNSCYMYMFSGCTHLTIAPDLPATTLAKSCYNSMFYGCTSLTSAPDLLAEITELNAVTDCYSYMFYNCTNLNRIKCYFDPNNYTGYTYKWVDGVSSTGKFIKKAETTWQTGKSGIPSGWEVSTE